MKIKSVKNVLGNISDAREYARNERNVALSSERLANGIIPLRGPRVDKDLSAGVIVIGAVFPDHRRQDLRPTFPRRGNKLSSLYQLRGMRASGRRKSVARKSTRRGISKRGERREKEKKKKKRESSSNYIIRQHFFHSHTSGTIRIFQPPPPSLFFLLGRIRFIGRRHFNHRRFFR